MGMEITYECDELQKLFDISDKIKISIPINYTLFIHNNNEVTELGQGVHIINKDDVTKIKIVKLRQQTYLIKDYLGNVITVIPDINLIDWDDIYINYGYDDYWIYYPNNIIRPYYYFNHPRYNPRRYPYVRKRTSTARTVARDVRSPRIRTGTRTGTRTRR
jgi:hypothetical protein